LALWDECVHLGMPRAVAISRLDGLHSSYADTLALCQTSFGQSGGQAVLPLYMPEGGGGGQPPTALVGLLSRRRSDYANGFPPKGTDASAETADDPGFEEARSALIEAIIAESEDETLLDRYVAGEDLSWTSSWTTSRRPSLKAASTRSCPFARPPGLGWLSCSKSFRVPSRPRSSTTCRR
jgi:elongation factor G